MQNLEISTKEDLKHNEMLEINGGGEGYAFWFGKAVRTAVVNTFTPWNLGPAVNYYIDNA